VFRNVVPWGGWLARTARFRRARLWAWSRKGWGGAYGPLGSGFGRWTGVERLRRGSSAAPGSVAAAAAVPSDAAANARQPAVVVALGDARGMVGAAA
jgi:hypothetical protein